MTNLCLVVIATQFSETRQKESALIEEANKKARLSKSLSTLASTSDRPQENDDGCYAAILGLIVQQMRRFKRRLRRRFPNIFGRKPKAKKKRKIRKVPQPTIHLHHHHHHHIHHHHHHVCNGSQSSSCSGNDPVLSSTVVLKDPALPPPTILQIENIDDEEQRTAAGPLAIQSAALLMPDTTVLICRSRPTSSSKSSQASNHTVSFFSTPFAEPGTHPDAESPIKNTEMSTDVFDGRRKSGSDRKSFDNYEKDIDPEKYEQYFTQESDDESEEEEEYVKKSCWKKCRHKVRDFCETSFFRYFIMGAIVVNTITMGMEHHGQVLKNYFTAR